MRNYFIIICSFLLIFGLSSWQPIDNFYKLQGELTSAPDGTKIALVPFSKFDAKPEAETTIEGGKFSFKGQVPEPRLYFLVLGNKESYYRVMIENSTISVKGEVKKKPGKDGDPDSYYFDKMEVFGSKSNDYLYSQLAVKDVLDKLYKEKNERYADIIEIYNKAYIAKDKARLDSIQNLPRYVEYSEAEKSFFKTINQRYGEVFEANKETFWGPVMMLTLYSYFTPEVRPTFEKMSKEAKESYYGKMVAEDLYPANRTGEAVPDFKTTDENGNKYTLNDLIKDKKVILIDFWASWCGPCRRELPNVKANYEKYASKGFEVLSFSIDKDPKAWKKAIAEEGLKWPNFNDLDVSTLYKVKSVPTTYLIDSKGHLIADNVRGEELGEKLKELFK